MPKFSDDFLYQLRARNDIEQLISSYVSLRRRGKNLVGLCPFHNEKTPSFTVYPETQSFYCFGCGAGGEAISFVRRIENLDYIEAVRFLCERSGMQMPTEGYDDSIAKKRKRIYEINKKAARFFHDVLFSSEGKDALEYYKKRGYTKKTIVRFGLGYAPNDWRKLLNYMHEKGYSNQELYEANLANKSEKNGKVNYYDSFRNRVIVPIIDVRGNIVAFGARVLDDSKPKYINTSDTLVYKKSLGVFGLNFAKNSKENSLIIVEGYMDAIALHQAGFDNAIACLGTALTNEMAHLLSRYCDEVILSYDADEAGQKATKRAIDIFSSIGMKIKVAHLTGGKDPDEILKKYGAERYRSIISGAANDIEFALVKEESGFDLTTDDGKLQYLKKAVEILASCGDSIARDIYSSRLAEKLNVEKKTVADRVEAIRKRNYSQRAFKKRTDMARSASESLTKQAQTSPLGIRGVRAQERIIATLMKSPDLIAVCGELDDACFDEIYGLLYNKIKEKIESGDSLEFSAFAHELDNKEMDTLVGICKRQEAFPTGKQELSDCVNVALEEKEKKKKASIKVSEMSDEDFLSFFKNKK